MGRGRATTLPAWMTSPGAADAGRPGQTALGAQPNQPQAELDVALFVRNVRNEVEDGEIRPDMGGRRYEIRG